MNGPTLLPCPFCGTVERDDEQEAASEALARGKPTDGIRWLQVSSSPGAYSVECFGCGVETRGFEKSDEAIAAWNRRHSVVTVNEARARQGGEGLPPYRRTCIFATARHIDLRGIASSQEEAAAIFGLAGDEPYTFEEVHLVLTDRCIAFALTEPQIAKLIAAGGRPC